MASTRISAPIRGVSHQLSRLATRPDALATRCAVRHSSPPRSTLLTLFQKCLSTPFARSISTSTSPQASLSSITTSARDHVPVTPFEEQTVVATIHQFPSLEPLRFETYPANHLYLPTRKDILHRAVIYEGDMTREGTASTKSRHEVRGSARKIRPQKGSGRARLGDKKSPMLRGGGVAFGPRPRDFATALPKKVYDLAWRTALSYRFRKGELIIVDNAMELESPSTRLLEDMFKYHNSLYGKGRNLMVTAGERPLLEYALGQMGRGEQTLTWEEVDVKDLLQLTRVIIERDALRNILSAHQDDIVHKTPPSRPVYGSGATDLKGMTGWAEFSKLHLAEEQEVKTIRPTIYESVADKRYKLASRLSSSDPERTDLTISAYNLLAEAKQIHFERTTGTLFDEYAAQPEDIIFPRIQQLDHQIQNNNAYIQDESALSSSSTQVNALQQETTALELQALEIRKEAALLAAQVHDYRAEALQFAEQAGMTKQERRQMKRQAQAALDLDSEDFSEVDEKREAARIERENADAFDADILTLKVRQAQFAYDVSGTKKAAKALEAAQEEVARREAERMAQEEASEKRAAMLVEREARREKKKEAAREKWEKGVQSGEEEAKK
jgi:large subunit ribosomal protein L4